MINKYSSYKKLNKRMKKLYNIWQIKKMIKNNYLKFT